MQFTITIKCDNAAFSPDPEREITRILYDVADRINAKGVHANGPYRIADLNGNTVGQFEATEQVTP